MAQKNRQVFWLKRHRPPSLSGKTNGIIGGFFFLQWRDRAGFSPGFPEVGESAHPVFFYSIVAKTVCFQPYSHMLTVLTRGSVTDFFDTVKYNYLPSRTNLNISPYFLFTQWFYAACPKSLCGSSKNR